MEENNNIESVNKTEEVVAQESVVAEVATSANEATVCSEPANSSEPKVVRKNGRNRGGNRNSKNSATVSFSRETCGELENPADFKEKLSGQNVSGYPDGEGYSETSQRREKRERFDRRERGERRRRENLDSESIEVSNEAESVVSEAVDGDSKEQEHRGPMFESGKFTPRAVEVALSDHRPKNKPDSSVDSGVVSYTPEDNKCSISLFDRIKNIVKSIFGKKEKSKKRYDKKGGKKNWNNNRDGGKRYNNHKGKGGYNKRRYNDRRPNGGGNKSRGNGKPQE